MHVHGAAPETVGEDGCETQEHLEELYALRCHPT